MITRYIRRGYAKSLSKEHGLEQANAVYTPLPKDADVTASRPEERLLSRDEHAKYRSMIGGLLYLTVWAVSLGLKYPRSRRILHDSFFAHVDVDWGGCRGTRKSTTGYVITINGAPVAWKSRKQTVIALSSGEAEYGAPSECARQTSWLRRLFWEFSHKRPWSEGIVFPCTRVAVDSTTAQSLANCEQISAKSKHIDLKYHHVKELVKSGIIRLVRVASAENIADLLTKALEYPKLRHFISLMNLSHDSFTKEPEAKQEFFASRFPVSLPTYSLLWIIPPTFLSTFVVCVEEAVCNVKMRG
eukprot:IDg771t1